MSDSVNKPSHYTGGSVECIDGIRAALGEGFVSYCRGNVLKYVWRCGKKGDALEDLRKAAKYLQWAIEAMEANSSEVPNSSAGKTLAIPEGWRELEENEPLCENDLFEFGGEWVGHECDPAGGVYSSRIHRRHIRKIEIENPSEIQDANHVDGVWIEDAGEVEPTEWIPKVGDKVRVIKPKMMATGRIGTISRFGEGTYSVRVESQKLTSFGLEAKDLELIEAAQ